MATPMPDGRGVAFLSNENPRIVRGFRLSKRIYDKRVDGKQAPRPGAAPQIYDLSRRQFRQGRNLKTQRVFSLPATLSSFCLNPSDSGRKNCKETVFALEN